MAYESLLDKIGSVPYRELIKGWLKAGYIDQGIKSLTETGTPQGGVISPLLANIGLHGWEEHIKEINPKQGIIRYADDLSITAKDKESLERVLIQIKQWCSERGLSISAEKTRIVHINDGFNFLGFNLRHDNGKLLLKPQKEKVLGFCQKSGQTRSEMKASTQEQVISKLNPLLRGFANYSRGVISKETFSYQRIWQYL